ncbi:hypothetical protein J2S55_007200 [Streptosporangium brasiliense]|uniref:Beta-mannosidase-like galactose-binding domain-containing protein n=1 Tax=Streptosporangium brasiliense TaxID=47480 RepID=A0ABT9RGU2_9ACTN|nr:hypothetical protein [Streptosporangium brasiliense]MDP9867934.1 hypothetical protein [Streptosporangium brasiliense]
MRKQVGDRPTTCTEPFNFVRKMACSSGWDWGPTLVTAGMWRSACPDRDFACPPPRMDVEVVPTATGCQVMITARTLIRDLYLHADRLHPEAAADQGLTTLLPASATPSPCTAGRADRTSSAAPCAAPTPVDPPDLESPCTSSPARPA